MGIRASRLERRKHANNAWWMENWVICFGLAAVTLVLYGQVAGHNFIRFDDESYVNQNLHVKAGLTWKTFLWAWTSKECSNWHPLTWLSHALDYQLFGGWAGGHHLTSALIHVCNVLLLFILLRRATGRIGCSVFVAALFAWHPINVESVAWVAERKNVLSTLFFLLTLGAYGWYARKPGWNRYLAVALLFAFGLAAKPMIVTLPFVLLLLDFWPLQRMRTRLRPAKDPALPQWTFWQLVLEKLPLLALSVASSAVTVNAQERTLTTLGNLSFAVRVANTLHSYLMYIAKMLWPAGLAIYYPHPFIPTPNHVPGAAQYALAALSALLIIGVSFFAWRLRFTHPYLLVGWFWYLGTLVPVIGIVQVGMQGMADRYAYVPLIGLFVAMTWFTADFLKHRLVRTGMSQTAAVIVLAVLWLLSFRQLGFWRTNYEIWAHTLEVTEDNYIADDNMADALRDLGRPDWLQYFQHAASIAPSDAISHQAIAANLEDQGRLRAAIPEYEVVVRRPPSAKLLALAYANLGIIHFELGDGAKAHAEFQKALSTDSQAVEGMIRNLAESVKQHPSDEGYLRLGFLFAQSGRMQEARNACQRALELKPDRVEALRCLDQLSGPGN